MSIWSIPNESDLYTEDAAERPRSNRMSSGFGVVLNKIGEEILKKVSRSRGDTIYGGFYDSLIHGMQASYNAAKHRDGKAVMKMPDIPLVKKVIQEPWAFAHLAYGLGSYDAIYTKESNGREGIIYVQEKGTNVDTAELLQMVEEARIKDVSLENNVTKALAEGYVNNDTINAGGIYELTDGDVLQKNLLDLEKLKRTYKMAEPALYGKKGKKTHVATTHTGEKIYRYDKPSAMDFLKFYGEMDFLYTGVSSTAALAEKLLSGVGAQRIYDAEVTSVVKSTLKRYNGTNPLNFYMN